MATYEPNPSHFLPALDSALSQTWSNIEVVIRDDSQTEIVKKIIDARKDHRIQYKKNHAPLGTAANHWQAFREARGEFITILNHDDLLDHGFVDSLLSSLLQFPDAVLAFCDHWIIDDNGTIQVDASDHASRTYLRAALPAGIHRPFASLLLNQTIPMAMGSMFRRNALPGQEPSNCGPAYDLWLTYYLARTGDGAVYIPERLSSWRCHSTNITSSGSLPWLIGSASCWKAVAADPLMVAHRDKAKRKAAEGFVRCGLTSWRNNKPRSGIHFAIQSIRVRPNNRAFAVLGLSFLPFSLIKKLLAFFRSSCEF
jgi:glycosyltransferase involved in cell wall biosynthesis